MPAALLQRASSGKMENEELSATSFHKHFHTSHSGKDDDASIIAYEDEIERLNSTMQLAWSEVMDDAYYTSSTNYDRVEVLMLSWAREADDLQVQKEMDDLKEVFEETYNFHVTRETIKKREKKRAQTQINAVVASWVDQFDAPKTLLTVYFAGHGRPGDQMGELAITGYQSSPSDVRRYQNTVVWNITENNLHGIQSDVLQIFDCCYAGTLGTTRGVSQQSFEYLAATGADDTTPSPGDTSFTSALIWALKELSKDRTGRFTTVHLLEKIQQAPDFPRDQKPVLSKRRENPANERIILHKVGSPVGGSTLNGNGTVHRNTPQQDVLTLKFVFDARPSETDIRNLGMDLNHVVRQHQLHVNRIMWGGIQPRENDMVFRFVSNLKSLRSNRKRLNDSIDAYPSKTTALAAQFVKDLQEEVEEHVHDQVQEEVPQRVHEELQREKEELMAQRMIQKTPTIAMLE